VDFDGRCLELEGPGDGTSGRLGKCVLGLVVLTILGSRVRIGVRSRDVGVVWRFWGLRCEEARSVGSRLNTELSEVQIGTSLVSQIHGLLQTLLRVEAVEDNGVDEDDQQFNDDFNDRTDE